MFLGALWLVAMSSVLSPDARAGELVVNDVAIGKVELTVRGLEGARLEKCAALQIGPNGDVRLSCPGYNLRASGGEKKASETDAPPVIIGRRYWLVTERPSGAAPVDAELYVNGRLVRMKGSDGPLALDVTERLVPGRNTLVLGARRSTVARTAGAATLRVLFGAGERTQGGAVRLDETVLDASLGESDTTAAPRALDFVAR
jgi:hypothetical protein